MATNAQYLYNISHSEDIGSNIADGTNARVSIRKAMLLPSGFVVETFIRRNRLGGGDVFTAEVDLTPAGGSTENISYPSTFAGSSPSGNGVNVREQAKDRYQNILEHFNFE